MKSSTTNIKRAPGKRTTTTAAPNKDANTLVPPKVGEIWIGQGGRFAGIALNDDATEDHYLVVYDGLYDGEANFKTVDKWATKLSADGHKDFTPPTKSEGPILYGNLKPTLFKDGGWYWTKTRSAGASSFAWSQSFSHGLQYNCHVDFKRRGCAVRRIKIIR